MFWKNLSRPADIWKLSFLQLTLPHQKFTYLDTKYRFPNFFFVQLLMSNLLYSLPLWPMEQWHLVRDKCVQLNYQDAYFEAPGSGLYSKWIIYRCKWWQGQACQGRFCRFHTFIPHNAAHVKHFRLHIHTPEKLIFLSSDKSSFVFYSVHYVGVHYNPSKHS